MILQPDHIAIDYSFARPAPPTIASAGVKLVCRYISPVRTNKKNLTPAERDALHAAGLAILLVWENGQLDPLSGAPKGQLHGKDARSYANDLGYPKDLPIIAAVDFDVQPAQMGTVVAYLQAFHGAADGLGTYGKDTVITAAHDLCGSTLGWQTVAWSGGRRSPFADVLQHARPVHPTVPPLGAVDDNTVLRPVSAWSTLPDPPGPPNPQPPGDDDVQIRLLTLTDSDARFLAETTADGRALNCRWASGALDQVVAAHRAAAAGKQTQFEQAGNIAGLANVALLGPLPVGDSKHTWDGGEFAAFDKPPVGVEDRVAREEIGKVRADTFAIEASVEKMKAGFVAIGSGG